MFKKRNSEKPADKPLLSKSEQKKIDRIVKTAKRDDGIPRTAQQTIPFERMFADGTCRVRDGYYTRTIQFQDINYQLALQEDKTAIFEEWCSFLNFFDSSVHFEFSFVNMAADAESFEHSIRIRPRQDGFDDIRAEYSQMLKKQLAQGNNGLTKTKYLTFGIEAAAMRQAKPRLDHLQNDILNNFRRLGAAARVLNGEERLRLMHDMFHMDGESKFRFNWKDLPKSGLSAKDFIAPSAFAFNTRTCQIGGMYGAMSFLSITASDLSDQLLKDFLGMESSQVVTMHIHSVDQNKAIKTVKRTITELDRGKIEEQKKAVRAGYDIDILPSDLATYGRDAKNLLKELQSQNERMFLLTFLILNTGRTPQELETTVFQAASIAQKHNCQLTRLDWQQEQGLMSSLPLAHNMVEAERALTTSSTAIFIPFTTQELFQAGEGALYYGLNALSNNLIMVDRKRLKNPNGLILGTPGSGKSFAAKREITNAFLSTDDDIIVCDPEAEYAALVERLHGQVIKISPTSTQYINPMDINSNYSEEDNPIALKSDFILSLCELVVGGKEGLLPVEKTVIDRCVHQIYQEYFRDPQPGKMPLLEDLYNALLKQEEKEAHHVATALEIYVKGSLNLFNHRTNVDINNRFVCYDIRELGKQLKKIGMLVVQDQVWGRVTTNRYGGKTTRYYVDEFHLLLREEQTAAYSIEIWKRFRKWGGAPTGITQNVKDLLASREVENIFENSDFILMLNQAAGDRQILAKQLNISPHQLSYGGESSEETTAPSVFETNEEEPVTVVEQDTGPLTPEGNLTVVDDYQTTFSDGTAQQFITLVSKSGAYFYLIIDRAADGDQTAHFLNMVDEADLMALMDEEDIPEPEPEPEPAPEPEPLPEPEPEEEEDGAGKFILVLLVLAGIAGGGAYLWLKMQQKKREAEENKPDPDADYREDEEEIVLPDEEPETDEEAERKAYQASDGYEEE